MSVPKNFLGSLWVPVLKKLLGSFWVSVLEKLLDSLWVSVLKKNDWAVPVCLYLKTFGQYLGVCSEETSGQVKSD